MTKKANNRKIMPVLLAVALLVSFGCTKKENQPPPQSQPKPAAKPVQPVQAQASSAKPVAVVDNLLDFSNKKDPFKPFVAEPVPQGQPRPAGAARAARRTDLLPIQSYEVNRFRISGIITGLNENTALIIDPAGKGYVVREGMPLGINDGRITRITSTAIEVVEQYRDDNGHLRKRNILLALPKKK
jgi:type IV pilus assembly protein PilP